MSERQTDSPNLRLELETNEEKKTCFGITLSPATIILFSLIWNTAFAVSQMVASFISKSLALMGDSSTMFLDSVTYGFNYWLEKERRKKNGKRSKDELEWIEIYVSGLSVVVLVAVSVVFFVLAIVRIVHAKNSDKTVEAPVVFVFASINLIFDIASTVLFMMDRKDLVDNKDRMNVNFCSAFLHILADFMRTFSELAASLFVICFDTDSELTDAYCTIVVEAFILGPAIYVSVELHSRIRKLRCRADGIRIDEDEVGAGRHRVEGSQPLISSGVAVEENKEAEEERGLGCSHE
eukprot:g1518.t1